MVGNNPVVVEEYLTLENGIVPAIDRSVSVFVTCLVATGKCKRKRFEIHDSSVWTWSGMCDVCSSAGATKCSMSFVPHC